MGEQTSAIVVMADPLSREDLQPWVLLHSPVSLVSLQIQMRDGRGGEGARLSFAFPDL